MFMKKVLKYFLRRYKIFFLKNKKGKVRDKSMCSTVVDLEDLFYFFQNLGKTRPHKILRVCAFSLAYTKMHFQIFTFAAATYFHYILLF